MVRENVECINDPTTIEEMLTFVHDEKTYKPQAEQGAHDDCVMALAIAHYIRPQQSYISTKDLKTAKWSKEQWEDYRNADASGKEYLRKIWGSPR